MHQFLSPVFECRDAANVLRTRARAVSTFLQVTAVVIWKALCLKLKPNTYLLLPLVCHPQPFHLPPASSPGLSRRESSASESTRFEQNSSQSSPSSASEPLWVCTPPPFHPCRSSSSGTSVEKKVFEKKGPRGRRLTGGNGGKLLDGILRLLGFLLGNCELGLGSDFMRLYRGGPAERAGS